MSGLQAAAGDYLRVRRAVGYRLAGNDAELASFVDYLARHDTTTVTVAAALDWAAGASRQGVKARRLSIVRGFARYLHALDPTHEIPPTRLIVARRSRPTPYLYRDADVVELMTAARQLTPELHAATTETVIGLLAVTGMRISEVLKLNHTDINGPAGHLTVWFTKFNKSRHIPLSPSTIAALDRYRHTRLQLTPPGADQAAMFVTPTGRRLTYGAFSSVFTSLIDTIGLTTPFGRRPHIHELRHSFAVSTMLRWHRDHADIHVLLPRLSTYLGHVDPVSTYWYLTAAPELMALAVERLDQLQQRQEARP